MTAGFDAGGDWAVDFGDQTGRIKCYALLSGSCFLSLDGVANAVRLEAGDCFVLPSGRPFRLGSAPDLPAVSATAVFAGTRVGDVVTHNGGGDLILAGSRFEVEGRHAELLLGSLPPVIHLHAAGERTAWRWSLDRLREEVADDRPGGSLMVQYLAHMMLVQVLRLYLSEQSGAGMGWFSALADATLAADIAAMHTDPGHRWTLAELAARAGMSRSIFAACFRDRVGETPLGYLTRWRMTLASEMLVTTSDPLVRVAQSVGYASEGAFNTAFKRIIGNSPRRHAREHGMR